MVSSSRITEMSEIYLFRNIFLLHQSQTTQKTKETTSALQMQLKKSNFRVVYEF